MIDEFIQYEKESLTPNALAVYKGTIKEEYCTLSPLHKELIIKQIDSPQIDIYEKLTNIWCPYLETVYGVFEDEGKTYAATEFVKRPDCFNYKLLDALNLGTTSLSLAEYFDENVFSALHGPSTPMLQESWALELVYHLCEAVEQLAELGIVHGDISPQNILLTTRTPLCNQVSTVRDCCPFSVKLIDFGISKEKKNQFHAVTTVQGTKSFSAPEILSYNRPSDKVDMYSLGCILFYLCTGKSPAEVDYSKEKKQLDKHIIRIIDKCTDDYDLRYKSITELKKDLQKQINQHNILETTIRRVPGFRSDVLYKKIIASFFYISLLFRWLFYLRHFELTTAINDGLPRFTLLFLLELIVLFDALNLKQKWNAYKVWCKRHPKGYRLLCFALSIFLIYLVYLGVHYPIIQAILDFTKLFTIYL